MIDKYSISQILLIQINHLKLQNSYMIQTMTTGFGQPNFMEMLSQNPLYTFSLIVDLAGIFLRGVVYWLVLKGISLGLK